MKRTNIILALLMLLMAFTSAAQADYNVIVVTDINKAIAEKWVVTFRVDGQYLYGSDFQNCLMGDAATAVSSKNVVVGYKIERDGNNYLFRCVTPRGTDYNAWHWTKPFYLNSSDKKLSVSFNLVLNGRKGMDMKNGAVWSLQSDGSIRNVGSGLYLGGMKMYSRPVKCEIVRIVSATPSPSSTKGTTAKQTTQSTQNGNKELAEKDFNTGSDYYEKGNYTEAVKYFREAAELGHAGAQNTLGLCYYNGIGVTKNMAEAAKWFRKAAEQGHAFAQFSLGQCYAYGVGVTKDAAEAIKWFRKAGEQGLAEAQFLVGSYYFLSKDVTTDYAEAVKWFRKAAEQGHADAQNALGICYQFGKGVTENEAEAVKWYRKAAEQGLAGAQFMLGGCYFSGEGVTENAAEAAKWYRKAAEQGLAEAQYKLGDCYFCGKGVTKNDAEAIKWYRKAAEQGNTEAQNQLGDCYFYGFGVKENRAEAEKWYRKAAEQGHGKAK